MRTYLIVRAGEAFSHNLPLQSTALLDGQILVVLSQSGLALLIDQQHKPDRHLPPILKLRHKNRPEALQEFEVDSEIRLLGDSARSSDRSHVKTEMQS